MKEKLIDFIMSPNIFEYNMIGIDKVKISPLCYNRC